MADDPTPIGRAESWFTSRGWSPFAFQREVWDAYLAGESGLIHAATGTGKTLAAWWGPILEWMREERERSEAEAIPAARKRRTSARESASPLRVIWVTPLRALAADTLEAISQPLRDLSIPWTVECRTGPNFSIVLRRTHASSVRISASVRPVYAFAKGTSAPSFQTAKV